MPIASIIVPIYHDDTKIETTLQALARFFSEEHINGEIIVINDGGTDGGAAVVEKYQQQFPFIKLINRTVNRGKGYSVREGLSAATGEYLIYTDADLPYLTKPITKMLSAMKSGEADFLLANRDLSTAAGEKKPGFPRQITHLIYSFLVRLCIAIPFTDTLAGLKAMRREVAEKILPKLTIDRFSFDVELLLAVRRAGFKIKEMAVSLKNVGKSNLKIRRDAPQMFKDVLKIWLQDKRGLYR